MLSSKQPCVLDGEIVARNIKTNEILSFSHIMKMPKKNKSETQQKNQEVGLLIIAFDCLVYNGKDLTDESISVRKQALSSLLGSLPPDELVSIVEVKSKTIDISTDESMKSLQTDVEESKKQGFEGIMIKPTGPSSTYLPASRSQWIKVKTVAKEDEDNASDSLDLVVMGAYYGSVGSNF